MGLDRRHAWDWWAGGGIGTTSADVPVRVASWIADWRARPPSRAAASIIGVGTVAVAVGESFVGASIGFGVLWAPLVIISVLLGTRATTTLCTWLAVSVGVANDVSNEVDAGLVVLDAALRFLGLAGSAIVTSFGVIATVELTRRGRTDLRTGLLNHDGFIAVTERERERALRSGASLSLVYLDLDGLKTANDQHGHAYGDELLAGFARHLDRCRRVGDVPARLGGDEFALLLPDTDGAGVDRVLRRLFRSLDEDSRSLSVSAGAVTWTIPPPVPTMLRQADQLMYRAKQGGGRCWVTRRVGGEGSAGRTGQPEGDDGVSG